MCTRFGTGCFKGAWKTLAADSIATTLNMIRSYLFVQFVQLAEQFKVARVCKGLCEDNFSDKLNFSMKLCNNATSWNRILIKIKIYWIQHAQCALHTHQRKKLSNILL